MERITGDPDWFQSGEQCGTQPVPGFMPVPGRVEKGGDGSRYGNGGYLCHYAGVCSGGGNL